MKVALLAPGGVARGGTGAVIPCLLWLVERLVERGCEVHVFVPNQEPGPGRWTLLGATVHNAGPRPRTARMLRAVLAEHRRAPFDVIHGLWAGPGAVGAIAARLTGVPFLLTLAGGETANHPAIGYGGLTSIVGRLSLRVASGAAQVVTAPSAFISRQAAALGIAVRTVPLGVDLGAWPPRPPRPRTGGAPLRLLHVGSLNPVKDQGTLLKAMAILRDAGERFTLDVIGFDTLGGEIQAAAAALRLDSVVCFRGFAEHAALRPWFENADMLVVSSIHEAGPIVLLEAALAGLPTVGTQVGHIADLAPRAAVAAPVGDAAALAEAIRALARDEPRRLLMAASAQDFAVRHDADFTAEAMLGLYRTLVAQSPRGCSIPATG